MNTILVVTIPAFVIASYYASAIYALFSQVNAALAPVLG